MRKLATPCGAAVLAAVLASVSLAQAPTPPAKGSGTDGAVTKSAVVFASADKAEFKEAIPGVSKSALWGDAARGAYGAFTKFRPGLDGGMHTHPHDIWIVGLKGAYIYRDEAGEKRVGPGQFIWIPAGKKHWSGGDATAGALFHEESSGAFGLTPAK